jgi:hypothetical protein
MTFLIDYDRRAGRIVSIRSFSNAERLKAQEERLQLDLNLRGAHADREVVLLEAEDENALRITHRRYFETLGDLIRSTESHPSLS